MENMTVTIPLWGGYFLNEAKATMAPAASAKENKKQGETGFGKKKFQIQVGFEQSTEDA